MGPASDLAAPRLSPRRRLRRQQNASYYTKISRRRARPGSL